MSDLKPLEERVKGFNEELIGLLGKWKLGLTASPLLNGSHMPEAFRKLYNISATPNVIDDSEEEKQDAPKEEPKAEESTAAPAESGVIPA